MSKKIISIILMAVLLLSVSVVFAQNENKSSSDVEKRDVVSQLNKTSEQERTNNNTEQENDKEEKVKSEVQGLENAMLRVKNNETRAKLEQVLSKIQDKRKEQLAKLEGMEVSKDEKTNQTIVKGKGKAKFLGFIPTSKNYEYEVDNQGEVKKHPKAFDFMFKKEDPIDS